jgi:glycine oxidase
MNNPDIIIVGGGLIGMLSARQLQSTGANVLLLEKGKTGRESSWAGGGILSPLYPWRYPEAVNRLAAYGHEHYEDVCQQLLDDTGIDPEWRKSGLLVPTLEEMPQAKAWANTYQRQLNILETREQLQQVAPSLSDSFAEGIWLPDVGQIRNPRLLKSLRRDLQQRKINIIENTPVTDILTNANGYVSGVKTPTSTYSAKTVILASGAWSGLFPEFAAADIKPVMGQMIVFKAPRDLLTRIILHNGRYVIPRRDGHIVCGSTLEWNDYTKTTTESARLELQQAAIRLVPELENLPIIHHWSGLRPGSPNGVPYIGQHPEIQGLYINAGHYRNGVIIGLGSVQLLGDMINGQVSFIDHSAYALNTHRPATDEYQ